MLKTIIINIIELYCNYIFVFFEFLYYKYQLFRYDYIEPKNSWKCLTLINNDDEYYEHYDNNIVPYKNNWSLFIQKLDNGCYLYNNELFFGSSYIQPIKSSVFFLSITVKQNNFTFNINLKKNEYIVGNNILSKLHILRYIKYNCLFNYNNFNINNPYKIIIMDSKMNTTEINAKQYILIDKTTYKVCNLQN